MPTTIAVAPAERSKERDDDAAITAPESSLSASGAVALDNPGAGSRIPAG